MAGPGKARQLILFSLLNLNRVQKGILISPIIYAAQNKSSTVCALACHCQHRCSALPVSMFGGALCPVLGLGADGTCPFSVPVRFGCMSLRGPRPVSPALCPWPHPISTRYAIPGTTRYRCFETWFMIRFQYPPQYSDLPVGISRIWTQRILYRTCLNDFGPIPERGIGMR